MDAVEVARQTAARLHARCARVADPTKPYAFALKAAEECGFVVNEVPVGSSRLDGGRAKVKHKSRLIIHEAATSAFEKAFLVAHEIGHAASGDGEGDNVSTNVDPARSSEQAKTSAEQVVDYGRKQRREVQMDLFAREFLLPRQLVRALHLEQKLSASEIASEYSAPFAVVVQQLFDALLLPQLEEQMTASEKTAAPDKNPEQKTAAEHLGVPFLLEAGPGTGKTRTLVDRVEFLLSKKVDAKKILVLTFSNKAAREMSDRIAARNKDAAVAMWIGTFHAFGLDIVRRFYAELGYEKDPQLRNKTEALELLEPEFAKLKLEHFKDLYDPTDNIDEILRAISRAKDEVTDAETYSALAAAMLEKAQTNEARLFAEKARDVGIAYGAYESLKRKSNCLDFGDLVFLPVKLLEKRTDICQKLKETYEHVLVDEYQDVNRSSVRLLAALTDKGKNLWAVGDPRQSIYRFRGASSFNISRFGKEDFPGGIRAELKLNYRSTPEIVSCFSTFAMGMQVGAPKDAFSAHRKSVDGTIELRSCDSPDTIALLVADAIEELRAKGVSYKEQSVLCSGNGKLVEYGETLERLGIPVVFLGSLFERQEIRHLLSLLSLLADTKAAGLVHLGASENLRLPLSDTAAILQFLRSNEVGSMQWASSEALLGTLSDNGRSTAAELKRLLKGFTSVSRPWDVLASYLVDRTRLAATMAESAEPRVKARSIAIWQFMNFVRVQPSGAGEPITRLLLRIRRLIRLGEDKELRDPPACAQALDAVRLTTIHRAKGLEFPAVHILGVHDNPFPGYFKKPPTIAPDGMLDGSEHSTLAAMTRSYKEERECLFYVAVSRARDHLRLFAATRNRGGAKQKTSLYVDRLGSGLRRHTPTTGRTLPGLPEDAPISLKFEGPLGFAAYEVKLFSNCPRSFFYSSILRAGGKKTTTPFLKMHDAVRKVVDALLAGSTGDVGEMLDKEFAGNRLAEEFNASDYRAFAVPMIEYFRGIRSGVKTSKVEPLSFPAGRGLVTVTPHELIEDVAGNKILRSIRTGSKRSKNHEDLEAAALLLAASKHLPGAEVEIVFLNDRECLPLTLSDTVLNNRTAEMTEFFSSVREGKFPTDRSQSCARCSMLFHCGATPSGDLIKKM